MKKLILLALILTGCAPSKLLMKKCDYLQGDYYFCEKAE